MKQILLDALDTTRKQNEKIYNLDGVITFLDYFEVYHEDQKDKVKTSTSLTTLTTFNSFKLFHDCDLNELTSSFVQKNIINPLIDCNSIETIKKKIRFFRKIFNWGLKNNLVIVNPGKDFFVPKNEEGILKNEDLCFSAEEWSKFERTYLYYLKEEKASDFPYFVVLATMYYTGMRFGEVLALEKDDINSKRDFLVVNKTCTELPKHVNPKGYIITTPKTKNSNRKVVIPKILEHYFHLYSVWRSKGKFIPIQDDIFLFGGNKPFRQHTIRMGYHKIRKKAGLPEYKLHSLRSAHATFLLQQGVSLKAVAYRLGDTESEIRKTYHKLLKNEKGKSVEILNEFYTKNIGLINDIIRN